MVHQHKEEAVSSTGERLDVSIMPGTIAIAQAVVMLVGTEHCAPGVWPHPVVVKDLPEDEAYVLIDLIRERFGPQEDSLRISCDPSV